MLTLNLQKSEVRSTRHIVLDTCPSLWTLNPM
ncbi:hypothetical protein AVEN_159809-1, partial [Araneus ventricosus]